MAFHRIELNSNRSRDRRGVVGVAPGKTYQAYIHHPKYFERRRVKYAADSDSYKLNVKEGLEYSIAFNPLGINGASVSLRGPIDLKDGSSARIKTRGRSDQKQIKFTAKETGTVHLLVSGGSFYDNGVYRFSVNEQSPQNVPPNEKVEIGPITRPDPRFSYVPRRDPNNPPNPTVDRSQLRVDTTLSESKHLTDSYEGYQPSLHAIRSATINLTGDITLSSDIQVKSHGPKYARNTEGVGQTGGRGGWGGGCPAWGARSATLIGDDSGQTIRMHSQTTSITDGLVRAYGFDTSTADLGNGRNTIDLTVKVTSGNDYDYRRWLPISSVSSDPKSSRYGDIQPTTYSKIWAYGEAYGYGMINSKVLTGNDADTINIKVEADNHQQGAPFLDARKNYSADSFGLHTTKLSTGAGNDSVNITALSQGSMTQKSGSYQVSSWWQKGIIKTHRYDDIGVFKSTIDLGDGDDLLTITTAKARIDRALTFYAGTAVEDSIINLGNGDDTFKLTGQIKASTFDGGDGYDILDLDENKPFSGWAFTAKANNQGRKAFKAALENREMIEGDAFYLPALTNHWGSTDVKVIGFEAIKIGGEIHQLNEISNLMSTDNP